MKLVDNDYQQSCVVRAVMMRPDHAKLVLPRPEQTADVSTKGFFDLPLELRQEIYDLLLPNEGRFFIPQRDGYWSQKGYNNASQVSSTMRSEMHDWTNRAKCRYIVELQHNRALPPEGMFEFGHGDFRLEIGYDYKGYDMNKHHFEALHDRVADFTSLLRGQKKLERVWISFLDVPSGYNVEFVDSRWCVPHTGRHTNSLRADAGTVLRRLRVPGSPRRNRIYIVEYLLLPLLGLPQCTHIDVDMLEDLNGRCE